jgi:hypothetical protein
MNRITFQFDIWFDYFYWLPKFTKTNVTIALEWLWFELSIIIYR